MADPIVSIKNVIKNNWVAANTSDVTPAWSTGWYDTTKQSPQISFSDEEEATLSDGPTGVIGISSGGSPSQYWLGSVAVNCWATRDDSAINPKLLISQFRKEIKRIVRANFEAITDLDFITWMGGHEDTETDKKPVVYRYAGVVGYGYLD